MSAHGRISIGAGAQPPTLAAAQRLPAVHERQNLDEVHAAVAADGAARWGVATRDWGDGLVQARCAAFPTAEAATMLAGYGPHRAEDLTQAIMWADEAGSGVHLRLDGADANPEATGALIAAGFVIAETEAWLWADPAVIPEPDGAVPVRNAETEADQALWMDAFAAGWGVGPDQRAFMAACLTGPHTPAAWRRLLIEIDGEAAGEALFTAYEGFGYFADAAVSPAYRGRGLQRVLIRARAALARQAGLARVFAGAAYGSPSHANMLKAGLTLAHTTLLWFRPPSAA